MNNEAVSILIADSLCLFRQGLVSLLENMGFNIKGEAATGLELVNRYAELKPELVLSDIYMPVLSGFGAAERILNDHSNARILFLSIHDGRYNIGRSLKLGVRGLVNKNILKDELAQAVNMVMHGEMYYKGYTPDELDGLIAEYNAHLYCVAANASPVSKREMDVLLLLSEGLSSIQISERLGISRKTVEGHKENLMKKFNVNSSISLIRYAFINGYLEGH